ncbi:MAG: AAA family ATPase [Candidatus Micrarchaeales archaeon]
MLSDATKRVIVITGTPGVGKTTLVNGLKGKIVDSKIYNATDIVNKFKLYSGKDKFGAKIVRMKQLERKINEIVKKEDHSTIIFEGHILADIKIKGAIAIVLREHLKTIKTRLLKRGYPIEKIRENIVSEALDYCGVSAADNYHPVYELLNGKKTMAQIILLAKGKSRKNRTSLNLTEELVGIIKSDSRFAI